jgi:S-formylglutathione hydrolase
MTGAWTRVEIANKPADVYDPPAGPRPRFGLLFLHPYGLETLAGKPAYKRLLDELRLACVCPHGGRSWWADRVCAEFDSIRTPERHVVDAVLPFFETRWGLRPRAVGLHGASMGGQGALRIAFRHPQLFAAAAAVAPTIEYHELHGQGLALDDMYDSKEQCRQDTVPMHVDPGRPPRHLFFCVDPDDRYWHRGGERLREKLSALGVAHECDLATRAGGHSWDYFNHMADRSVRFLVAALDQESRRLL